MIKSSYKTPWPGPRESLEIDVADVIQHIIVMTRNSANDEEFVVVEKCCVSRSAFRNGSRNYRLCPVGSLEVEYDEIG